MTAKQSTGRLALYALIAFVTPIASNWQAMEQATPYQWGGMLLQAFVTSLIAARAYIDTTPTKVPPMP